MIKLSVEVHKREDVNYLGDMWFGSTPSVKDTVQIGGTEYIVTDVIHAPVYSHTDGPALVTVVLS